jgi:hypothetical protein
MKYTQTILTVLFAIFLHLTGIAAHLTGNSSVMGAAALSTGAMTLIDYAKLLDPNDQVARIIELLSQTNEILLDMPFMEGNLITGHRTTVRTGLPDVFWRLLNQGVAPSKAHTAQIDEQTGMLEAFSQVDRALADLGGNRAGVRMSNARAFLEAMNNEMASTLIYGSASAPEEFIGLAARYSSSTAGNGDNVILGGGTGSTDNTSIYLVAWGEETVCGIYPKGSRAGLFHEDLGEKLIQNAGGVTGALMMALVDHWEWKCGLALKDWRYVVRIANIDVSNLSSASDQANLLRLMADAEERLPNELGSRAFYANRTVIRNMRHQTTSAVSAGGGITFENYAGKRTRMFGITPVRVTDAILNTEDVVA